jgi:hypothetical protein
MAAPAASAARRLAGPTAAPAPLGDLPTGDPDGWRDRDLPGRRNHLNCGTVGTLMRDGAIGATLEAFPIPLGSTDIFSNAPRVAAFGRAPPTPPECPIPAEPPPRANDAVGKAKTMKKTKATFTEVFDMGKLH